MQLRQHRVAIAGAIMCSALFSNVWAQNISTKGATEISSEAQTSPDVHAAPIKRDQQTIYRQVLPGGKVVYSDQPIQGHTIDKVIEVDLRSTDTWSTKPNLDYPSSDKKVASEDDQIAAQKLADRQKLQAQLTQRLRDAEKQFHLKQAALNEMETPLEGERLPNVNGTSRLSQAYFDRIERIKQEARLASLNYDAALSAMRQGH